MRHNLGAAISAARCFAANMEGSDLADFDGRETASLAAGDGTRFNAAVRSLAFRSVTHDAALLVEDIDALFGEREAFEEICLELLAPAAHHLGERWKEDAIDFLDVTTGIWRLQEAMRIIARRRSRSKKSSSPSTGAPATERVGRALFAAMPGDQHQFAPQMLEELFAADGWDSTTLSQPERGELLGRIADEAFDLVGLTLTKDSAPGPVRGLIEEIRGSSANPDIAVMIGGRTVNLNPAIVAEVGADGTGADARAALRTARELVQSAKLHAPMR